MNEQNSNNTKGTEQEQEVSHLDPQSLSPYATILTVPVYSTQKVCAYGKISFI